MYDGRPVLIDLFSGVGGAAKGYQRAGFYVIGVDIKPQPFYCGDEFYVGNALTFPLESADVIHASPPCQKWSKANNVRKLDHPDLVAPTRERIARFGVPYVIENVLNAPLHNPCHICGSSFGLRVRRHRIFESNVHIEGTECRHKWQNENPIFPPAYNPSTARRNTPSGIVSVYGSGGGKGSAPVEAWQEAMGIDWTARRRDISQAIPPAYSHWVGRQVREAL